MNTEKIITNFSNFLNFNLGAIEECLKKYPEYIEYLCIENFYYQALGARDMAVRLIMETPERASGFEKVAKIWRSYVRDYDKLATEAEQAYDKR